ncbi:MAG: hypothetical protein IBX63_11255, partial [Coriobacteriia bacterium]|nr:hypothetical protein [Coriobacteriia bacterium]
MRSTAPGQLEGSSAVSEYGPGGRLAKVTQADGSSWHTSTTRPATIEEARPLEGGATVSDLSGSSSGASYTYDADTARKTAENLSLLGSAADYSRSYLYTEAGRLG